MEPINNTFHLGSHQINCLLPSEPRSYFLVGKSLGHFWIKTLPPFHRPTKPISQKFNPHPSIYGEKCTTPICFLRASSIFNEKNMLISVVTFFFPYTYFGGVLGFALYFGSLFWACTTLAVNCHPFPPLSMLTVFFQQHIAVALQPAYTISIQWRADLAGFWVARQVPFHDLPLKFTSDSCQTV